MTVREENQTLAFMIPSMTTAGTTVALASYYCTYIYVYHSITKNFVHNIRY